ncbi:MAG: hypothetical protein VCG02_08410 [Verrucomicrobiota bacterium]|jgi:hypothetical protein
MPIGEPDGIAPARAMAGPEGHNRGIEYQAAGAKEPPGPVDPPVDSIASPGGPSRAMKPVDETGCVLHIFSMQITIQYCTA